MLKLKDVAHGPDLLGVSATVLPGRPAAIAGLSARAREQLARLIAGAERPQGGTIQLGDKDVQLLRKQKGAVVRVGPQGLLASGHRVGKLVGVEAAQRAGVAGKLNEKISNLPVAMRVRLALAQAAVTRPALLVVEAPLSQVEVGSREALAADLEDIVAGAGVVVVLARSADEALAMTDIVVMDGGRVVQAGTVDDVSAHPAHLAAAAATSWPTLNTVRLTVTSGRCVLPDGARLVLPDGLPQPPDGEATLAFHPRDMTIERAGPGCVRFVVRTGRESQAFLEVSFSGASWLCPMGEAAPPPGALLNAFVDSSRFRLFGADGRAAG